MSRHGTIEEFDGATEDWTAYSERLEQYFVANDVDEAAKKRAILLSVCGASTYKTRQNGDNVATFVSELRQLAMRCDFGASLEEMLRDRLVCGIKDEHIQRRLLAEPNLTFKKAQDIAQALESADRNTADLQQQVQAAVPVHALKKSQKPKNDRGYSTSTSKDTAPSRSSPTCYRCGGKHLAPDCRHKESECHTCGKKGHISRVCRSKGKTGGNSKPPKGQNAKVVEAEEESFVINLSKVRGQKVDPFMVSVLVDGKALEMEVDTGASVSLISEAIKVIGAIDVAAGYQDQREKLRLIVVAGDGPSLLGRDWLKSLRVKWDQLYKVKGTSDLTLQKVLDRHSLLFKDELGTIKGVTAKIYMDPAAHPQFFKPRPLPLALKASVEKELEKLQRENVISPVQFSDWAAPVVPVVKGDGSVRICGDFKVTVNKYNRLPFGVASAPAIFQRAMESLLQGLKHVAVYLDDILITGQSEADHLRTLEDVLGRLEAAGMRLKAAKCLFMQKEVEYLGHRITSEGIHPAAEKLRAIKDSPAPQNTQQLRSFLGPINYYSKFLPHLASLLAPLYTLLVKDKEWSWGNSQRKAFEKAKALLTASTLLTHFDSRKELILSCDASPYGVGAVLSHKTEDGEKPVAYASRSLATAERNYSQLDKEGLAIIFGVKKFHNYLYGRQFSIVTDHKPLIHLFSENRSIPAMASARLQRWALVLSAYQYKIVYKCGKDNANADMLSRLPLPECPADVPTPGETVLLMEILQSSPVSVEEIRTWTKEDPVLSKVKGLLINGWKGDDDSEDLRPFRQRHEELSLQDDCVLWGCRVVIPKPGQRLILEELHSGHQGISKMKSLARSFVWWPKLDADIEEKAKSCQVCQLHQKAPAQAPLHPWEWPEQPWFRVHADYAGPFKGKMFLLLVDAHSKWLEVHMMDSSTSAATIEKMKLSFACHGLPVLLVTDNGSNFTSQEFETFLKSHGVRHVRTAPYHPASNGQVERAVQTFKTAMKKSGGKGESMETRLSNFLFQYRITPHSSTGVSPAELLMGRRLRSHLSQLHPEGRIKNAQRRQKRDHDKTVKQRTFTVGDNVLVLNFGSGPKWLLGTVTQMRGPVSVQVQLTDGRSVHRHLDQVRNYNAAAPVKDQCQAETVPANSETFLYGKVCFGVLHLLLASIATFDTPPGSNPP
eukprot:Em0001g1691a